MELLELRRNIRRAEHVKGYVVGIGKKWVLLAYMNFEEVKVDRYVAVRLAHIDRVKPVKNAGFPRRAIELRGQWPPTAPSQPVDLDSTRRLIATAAGQSPLLNIEDENDAPNACYIGTVEQLTDKTVTLFEVSPAAEWQRHGRWKLADLTWVEFGGPYDAALLAVAGTPPPHDDHEVTH